MVIPVSCVDNAFGNPLPLRAGNAVFGFFVSFDSDVVIVAVEFLGGSARIFLPHVGVESCFMNCEADNVAYPWIVSGSVGAVARNRAVAVVFPICTPGSSLGLFPRLSSFEVMLIAPALSSTELGSLFCLVGAGWDILFVCCDIAVLIEDTFSLMRGGGV